MCVFIYIYIDTDYEYVRTYVISICHIPLMKRNSWTT